MKKLLSTLMLSLILAASGVSFAAGNGGPVPTLSGGIGDDELQTMQAEAKNYNLQLLFAEKTSGAYLSGVRLSLQNAAGKTVATADGAGPWFFARLPAGRYQVIAESGGLRQTRWINVAADPATKAYFYWPEAEGGSAR